MPSRRWDETWHRLHVWTNGQGPSERLAAQVLLAEGYRDLDPSHPLGGPDGGRDAIATRDGRRWVMAVYFPREQQRLKTIQDKLMLDYAGVTKNDAYGLVFVCNQELTLEERDALEGAVSGPLELYHLERVTAVLDQPRLGPVRRQFGLENDADYRLEALQTGGDTYAYVMLYHFDMTANIAQKLSLPDDHEVSPVRRPDPSPRLGQQRGRAQSQPRRAKQPRRLLNGEVAPSRVCLLPRVFRGSKRPVASGPAAQAVRSRWVLACSNPSQRASAGSRLPTHRQRIHR